MDNNANFSLRCIMDEIVVECKITFFNPIVDFIFSLNNLLVIDEITCNTDTSFYKSSEWKHNPYTPTNQEIKIISKKPYNDVTIRYHGKICGWCNIVEENRISLSNYSGWFLHKTNIPLNMTFTMYCMKDYYIINGTYNSIKETWFYDSLQGYDVGNIIAFKNNTYYKANTNNFTFYYLIKAEEIRGKYLVRYYDEIIKYYSNIFGDTDIKKFDVVSLGIIDGSGGGAAYFRKELIVSERMDLNLDSEYELQLNTASLLSHELAHNWFYGADFDSWEDWLNETCATWSSLLYAIDRNNDDLFNDILKWPKENFANSPVIKTIDGCRPVSGVHERGTMMFYEIFKYHGKESIISILKCFVELENKTTNNLLSLLRKKIGNEIPDLIAKGLTIEDYSSLHPK